jgi:RNA polymerase sigma factor (sigma-70 family)
MYMPTAFISYSWDDTSHRNWVKELATRLRTDGVTTILDQWEAVPGDQLPAFMETAVRTNDFVLMVCTPKYKARYDGRESGVGYEGDVIQAEIFVKNNHRKFIPILRKGSWDEVAPSVLLGKYYIDLRDSSGYSDNYRELLKTLRGERPKAPPVGTANSEGTTKQVRWTIVLDGTYDESVAPRVEAIVTHLRELLGDSGLTITKIEPGSVIVRLKGTQDGYARMRALFSSGELTHVLGMRIIQLSEDSWEQMTSRELVAQCARGLDQAWSELVRRFTPLIGKVIFSNMRRWGQTSPELADDLTQEVYLKLAADGARRLREVSTEHHDVFGFVKLIAASVTHDYFKAAQAQHRGSEKHESIASAPYRVEKDQSIERIEKELLGQEIERTLETIGTAQERRIFWLYYRTGLSAHEIAAIPSIDLTRKGIERTLLRLTTAVRVDLTSTRKKDRRPVREVRPSGTWRETQPTIPLTTLSKDAFVEILRDTGANAGEADADDAS